MTPAPASKSRLKIAAILVIAIVFAPVTIAILVAYVKTQGTR